jgi:hypothetical protein
MLIALGAAVALSGCATWSTSSIDRQGDIPRGALRPTVAENILLSEQDEVVKKYVALGDITVNVNKTTIFHPNPTKDLVDLKLREKAATLGADAVILVRYGNGGVSLMSWGSLEGKGRAIKYQQ